MKILLLNPHVDAWRNILQGLQNRGDAVLLPDNATEAWQLLQLHGTSLDLAVIHREFGNQPELGLRFIEKLKADTSLSDLPLILTSDQWADPDFAKHQQTPAGANAYLRCPFEPKTFFDTINAVFGIDHQAESVSEAIPDLETFPRLESTISLEDANALYRPEPTPTGASISLEQPSNIFELKVPVQNAPPDSVPAFDLASFNSTEPQEPAIDLSQMPSPDAYSIEKAIDGARKDDFLTPLGPDDSAAREMPYLFGKPSDPTKKTVTDLNLLFAQPMGDAIIPGGAGESPDVSTLKKFLQLREKDVAVLSSQLQGAKQQIAMLEGLLTEETNRTADLSRVLEEHKRKLAESQSGNHSEAQQLNSEISDLRFQLKAKTDKAKLFENQIREAAEEMDNLRERVRLDIRKIRVREKELENKLEILRKDSEVLIGAREGKIIELKRKLDLLEFNMDLMQDRYNREKEVSAELRARLAKAAQVVRVAGGFLDNPTPNDKNDDTPAKEAS